jgi:hypothetical protein
MRATTNLWPNIWPKQWTNAWTNLWTNLWTQNVFFFFSGIYHAWTNLFKKKQIKLPVVDPIIDYVEKQQAMLTKHADKTLLNQNIDPVFYSKKDFQFMLCDSKNRHETLWKTRILFASTPRGNIIMYYDVYKLGFTYYSDTQSIPYSILNATAMKYVRQFQCLDFFMDDRVFPEFHVSPLISILLAEEKKTTENKNETSTKFVPKQGPFAKLKTYSKKTGEEPDTKSTDGLAPKIYTTNRFICLGKIYNFKLLQHPPESKKIVVKEYTSKMFEPIHPVESHVDAVDQVPSKKTEVNYRAYKELRNRKVLLETSAVA